MLWPTALKPVLEEPIGRVGRYAVIKGQSRLTIPESRQDIGGVDTLVDPFQPAAKFAVRLHVTNSLTEFRGKCQQLFVMDGGGDQLVEAFRAGVPFSSQLFGNRALAFFLDLHKASSLLRLAVFFLGERSLQQAHHNIIELYFKGSLFPVAHGLLAEAPFNPEFKFAGVNQVVRSRAFEWGRLVRLLRGLPSDLALALTDEQLAVLVEHLDLNLPAVAEADLMSSTFQRGEEGLQQAEGPRLCQLADVDVEVVRQLHFPTEVRPLHDALVLPSGPQQLVADSKILRY